MRSPLSSHAAGWKGKCEECRRVARNGNCSMKCSRDMIVTADFMECLWLRDLFPEGSLNNFTNEVVSIYRKAVARFERE